MRKQQTRREGRGETGQTWRLRAGRRSAWLFSDEARCFATVCACLSLSLPTWNTEGRKQEEIVRRYIRKQGKTVGGGSGGEMEVEIMKQQLRQWV